MKEIDLQRLKEIIETVNANERADIDGTAERFDEELSGQGQRLWWNGEEYFIGPKEDPCSVCWPEECICTK